MNGTINLGQVVLNGSGQASFNAGALAAGSYSITAIYGGDATYAASTSATLAEVATSPPYIWVANGDQTLSKTNNSGLAFSPSGGYPGGGLGVAIDGFGNVWSGGSGNVTMLNKTGGGGQTFTAGGIATPASIAIAGDGSVWIANTNNTIANLSNNGTALSPSSGYNGGGLSTPTGLAIDASGNVWVTNTGDSSLTEFVGAAAPVVTPLATAVKNANQGGQP
jgi:sugar lactone lactonase YvrE